MGDTFFGFDTSIPNEDNKPNKRTTEPNKPKFKGNNDRFQDIRKKGQNNIRDNREGYNKSYNNNGGGNNYKNSYKNDNGSGSYSGRGRGRGRGGNRNNNLRESSDYIEHNVYDAHNDETFGTTMELGNDFDFISSNMEFMKIEEQTPTRNYQPNRNYQNNYRNQRYQKQEEYIPGQSVDLAQEYIPGQSIDLAQLFGEVKAEEEKIDTTQAKKRPAIPKKHFNFDIPDNVDWEKVRLERKAKREQQLILNSKYHDFMGVKNKELIMRIQISQLVSASETLTLDDYYFRLYSALDGATETSIYVPTDKKELHLSGGGKPKDPEFIRMQKQITKIVAEAMTRRNKTPIAFENALGKIDSKTARNPRKIIQVGKGINLEGGSIDVLPAIPAEDDIIPPSLARKAQTQVERKLTLKWVEDIYVAVLKAEIQARQRPLDPNEDPEAYSEWMGKFAESCNQCWLALGVENPSPVVALHHLLNINKGKRVMPRLARFISPDQTLLVITILLSNLERLNVCKDGVCPPKGKLSAEILTEVDVFIYNIVALVHNYINNAPLVIVNGLFQLCMEKNNVPWLARSKVGLTLLTLLLARIQTLRQSNSHLIGMMAPSPEIPLNRSSELFQILFELLHNHFIPLFPPLTSNIEDLYVWQFLASLAVGLNLDLQHALVIEVRDKVIEIVQLVNRPNTPPDVRNHRIANVNLFLHALGLDASQVNV